MIDVASRFFVGGMESVVLEVIACILTTVDMFTILFNISTFEKAKKYDCNSHCYFIFATSNI